MAYELAYFILLSLHFPYKNLHSLVRCTRAYFLEVFSPRSLLISVNISSTSLVLFSSLFSNYLIKISFRLLFRLSYFYLCRNYAREGGILGFALKIVC